MIIEFALIIIAAVIIDVILGEPPRRIHPTVWMGALTARLVVAAKAHRVHERAAGIGITLALTSIVAAPFVVLYAAVDVLDSGVQTVIVVVSAILLLSVAISVRSMIQHVLAVTVPLEANDITVAQQRLATVVKRSTNGLSRTHILSGLVETIAENTVDGVISPLSYFGLAGVPGALVYRAVNTIDAMIGYKTHELQDIGWFGASCDRVLNYIPARITAALMIVSAAILRLDWRGALATTRQDHAKTSSPNAGYPISAMAGALGVRLEKVGHYVIGEGKAEPTIHSVRQANRVMITCVALYVSIIITMISGLGALWWWPLV